MKFWRYKSERDELRKQVLQLRVDNESLRSEIFDLVGQLNKKERIYYYPSTEDPSPMDEQERAAYISNVVTFFENIGVKKINQLVAKAKEDLSNPLNERDYDLVIKGTINAFSQLLDWNDECVAELNQPKQDKVNQNNN